MAYNCAMEPTNSKYIFLEFSNTALNLVEARIYSRLYQMFRKGCESFCAIVHHYRISE